MTVHDAPPEPDHMAVIYVARSKSLSDWGASVGIGKQLFAVGVADGGGKAAVAALAAEAYAGATDWRLVTAEEAGDLSEEDALARLAAKERAIDPRYYPRIRGADGIFRVKRENVENSLLVQRALAGEESLEVTVKPADVGVYLIANARG